MARRIRTVRDMRAEYDAAEARGLIPADDAARTRAPRSAPLERKRAADTQPRVRVVWSVCDIGGRTIAQFDYVDKAQAEALAADLKARGKGNHFVRSEKIPMG